MPLYEQIIKNIMDRIQSGSLKEGDLLPTEMELCEKFNVSRPTVRTALLKLANDGYLTRIKGCGTFIAKPKLLQESTQFIESYNQEMKEKGLTPRTEVLEFRTIPAADSIAGRLNIQSGVKVIKLKRLRFVEPIFEGNPIVLTTVYMPYSIAPTILNCDMEKFSLYDLLNKKGIVISRVERELEIRMLSGKNARLLNEKDNSPAHFISSLGFTKKGEVIEYAESYYPADRNKFLIRINK